MKTFKDLKTETTKEILKWMFELADDGYEFITTMEGALWMKHQYWNASLSDFIDIDDFIILLYHTVEGWNRLCNNIYIYNDRIAVIGQAEYKFDNYKLTQHLTACEMAIWDCLIFIYKDKSGEFNTEIFESCGIFNADEITY